MTVTSLADGDRFYAEVDDRWCTFVAAAGIDPDDPAACWVQNCQTGAVTWWQQVTS